MKPEVYYAIQRFEREVHKRYPEVKLELIEPREGPDAAFQTTFPTPDWYQIWHQLHRITTDIEEETGVWIGISSGGYQEVNAPSRCEDKEPLAKVEK